MTNAEWQPGLTFDLRTCIIVHTEKGEREGESNWASLYEGLRKDLQRTVLSFYPN